MQKEKERDINIMKINEITLIDHIYEKNHSYV